GDCFYMILEAFRIAVKYMTPVIVLSDAYLANSAQPWKIPQIKDLKEIKVNSQAPQQPFLPYARNAESLSRPWVSPGIKGFEHRIGGLEKEHETGNISYDPENHQKMVNLRAAKVKKIEQDLPPLETIGAEQGKVLVVGWGGTYGVI